MGTIVNVFAVDIPNPLDLAKGAVGDAAESILSVIAGGIAKALEAATSSLATAWIRIDTPSVATPDGHASPVVAFLNSELAPYAAAVMVLAIILGAIRMAVEMRGDPGRDILIGLLTWVFITGAGAAVIGVAIELSDVAAEHILNDALKGDTFGKHLAAMLAVAGIGAPVGVIVVGSLALLTCLVQIVLMVARVGLLIVMVGMLPFVAAAAATKTGRTWLERYLTWMLAFILYKPVTAVIYATGLKLVDSGAFTGQGLLGSVVGLTLLVSSIAALPALMRIVAPVASAVARGNGMGAMVGTMVMRDSMRRVVRPGGRGPTGAAPVGARRTP
jgi:type IV secretion system protein TrbL